jgi:myo-inositol 2-dehydrogenase/D-chiro-inositol 1-dehydrogenase
MHPTPHASGAVLLGLLGCGRVAERFHAPAVARFRYARLTGAFDPSPDRARLVARLAPGCRAFDSADALLEARIVDAVVIASPPDNHGTLAVKALGAGLPVLIEPPLAATMEEAAWIREAEQVVRLPVTLGFNRRYWEPVERVRRALAAAAEPTVSVESVLATEAEADPLDALATHLDLMRYLLDLDLTTVSARRDGATIDARLAFPGESVAACRAGPGDQVEEVIGIRAGSRRYEIRAGSERVWPPAGLGRSVLDLMDSARRRALGNKEGLAISYDRQLAAFVGSVQSRVASGPGTADGLAAMLALEAIRRSLEAGGATVPVPSSFA